MCLYLCQPENSGQHKRPQPLYQLSALGYSPIEHWATPRIPGFDALLLRSSTQLTRPLERGSRSKSAVWKPCTYSGPNLKIFHILQPVQWHNNRISQPSRTWDLTLATTKLFPTTTSFLSSPSFRLIRWRNASNAYASLSLDFWSLGFASTKLSFLNSSNAKLITSDLKLNAPSDPKLDASPHAKLLTSINS